ncbi:MAG: guanylyltransferase [Candidatus Competibacteraceae bacterium]|nr:guanylyltransferase [Candidatus Competibacteraceae bacterium]
MRFDDLDRRLRVYETAHDHCALPGLYLVARLDGRSFTHLTREQQHFAAPFDERFRDLMIATVRHLMDCGFRVVYGYTQSDEISLLFHPDEDSFGRKLRKWLSILAGEASACFALRLGSLACFDCRISQLPTLENVVDYFRWRSEDAHRNALNAHSYWALRRTGLDARAATQALLGRSVAEKNEWLFQHGVNFNELPAWQKRGMGVYWETWAKPGQDPRRGETVTTTRRRLIVDQELPRGEAYDALIQRLARPDTA